MPTFTSPEIVVQRQLDAYSAKNLNAWLATYAEDAKQFEPGGSLLAQGHAQHLDSPNPICKPFS